MRQLSSQELNEISPDLIAMKSPNEVVFWHGRPAKLCFILEAIFNPMLVFAILWAVVDYIIIGMMFTTGGDEDYSEYMTYIILFFSVHLMPVWIYIGGVIGSVIKHKHTEYMITDKGIYVTGGIFSKTYEIKPFTDLAHVEIHRGIFDQFLGVGDVNSICEHSSMGNHNSSTHSSGHSANICDISDYLEVFQMIKQLQTDIYADTMYPNAKRPDVNPGYQTKYGNNS